MWFGVEFGGQGPWHRAGSVLSFLRNQLQAFRELSQGSLFLFMTYSTKLCLKISLAGSLFSEGPACGRIQSAASRYSPGAILGLHPSPVAGGTDPNQPLSQRETLRPETTDLA
jgi:hypothetical protein